MRPRVLAVVPMYNCARQIGRVLSQFTPDVARHIDRVLVVNNRSVDDGESVAAGYANALRGTVQAIVVRNHYNYGLGGSHKIGFAYAIEHGFERVVILHGDDQGLIGDLVPHMKDESCFQWQAYLGARFMTGSTLRGYSTLRTIGNKAFNLLFSAFTGRRIYDLGSGLNLYDVSILKDRFYERFPDDLTFNYCMVMAHAQLGHQVKFFPISWREADQVSNVRLFRQARKVLALLATFAANRSVFLNRDLRDRRHESYSFDLVACNF